MSLPSTYVPGFHDKDSVLKMGYVALGKTGLQVSKLSFGCSPLGNVYGEISEEEAINAVREAIRKGINYFDTAPLYGQGLSEEVLGKALAGVPREAYYVSTKVCRYGKTLADSFDRSESKVLSGFEHSLKLLGLDYVDIVIVHDVEFGPKQKILDETLPAAEKLVKQKKANHIGISGYPLQPILDIISNTDVNIELILTYSRDVIFDNTLQDYLPFFQSRDLGVINASLTAMGILSQEGPPSFHPADSELKILCAKAAEYAKSKGVNLANISVAYCLQQQGAHTYLVGMKTREILNTNLNILYNGLSETEKEVLEYIKSKIFNNKKKYHWEGKELDEYNKLNVQ